MIIVLFLILQYESPVNINEKPSVLEENWENISQEETQWMLLISKMEPALIISAIFRYLTPIWLCIPRSQTAQ